MTTEPNLDNYLDCLRQSLPSATDEARIQQRLAAAGLAVGVALASPTAAASTAAITKVGIMSALSVRFASLPLIAQMGLITAGTTVVASVPIVSVNHYQAETTRAVAPTASSVIAKVAPVARAAPAPNRDTSPPARDLAESPPPKPARASAAVVPGPTTTPSAAPQRRTVMVDRIAAQQLPTLVEQSSTVAMAEDVETESTLAQETRLINSALLAIRDGNLALANQQLADHASRFPSGRLKHERLRATQQLEQAARRSGSLK